MNWDAGGGSFASVTVCNALVVVRWRASWSLALLYISMLWFPSSDVVLRIVSLCLHPRVTLLGSGRCWIAHCWIVLRIELPCHPQGMTLLSLRAIMTYFKHHHWF